MTGGLEVPLTLKPMEAEPADALPLGDGWQFEPKHDGFRTLAFRDDGSVRLRSRNQRSLERYFPELVEAIGGYSRSRFVIDAEIVLGEGEFETLQLRLHPAASRIERLAREHPARLVCFDLLADAEGQSLMNEPFAARREALEDLLREPGASTRLELVKATRSPDEALTWLGQPGIDGIMAKRLDLTYRPGRRAMLKFKPRKTIDCVVGGLYWARGSRAVDSLLLGLYDEEGRLHYVGRARVYRDAEKMAEVLEPLFGGEGFTGRTPSGRSRWSGQARDYEPLDPLLVAEVSADHITGGFMRHGARLQRWRQDKQPRHCTLMQLENPG